MLMASPKDTRIMVVYGYARLVAYTPDLELVPDILERLDVEDGRVFTLHLRPGHKWSDGHPFTSEDFRYWFEDVAGNKELSMAGLPVVLMPHGEKPRFEVIDPLDRALYLGSGRTRCFCRHWPGRARSSSMRRRIT